MLECLENFFAEGSLIKQGRHDFWNFWLVGLNIASDSLIALAFYYIPLTLVSFAKKRRYLPLKWIFVLFGLALISCGTIHLIEVWMLWRPTYWLSSFVKVFTAFISVYIAVMLVPMIRKLKDLSKPELEEANYELQKK